MCSYTKWLCTWCKHGKWFFLLTGCCWGCHNRSMSNQKHPLADPTTNTSAILLRILQEPLFYIWSRCSIIPLSAASYCFTWSLCSQERTNILMVIDDPWRCQRNWHLYSWLTVRLCWSDTTTHDPLRCWHISNLVHALKVLDYRLLHELGDHADLITKVSPGDRQID